jgi:hypothetical protein
MQLFGHLGKEKASFAKSKHYTKIGQITESLTQQTDSS